MRSQGSLLVPSCQFGGYAANSSFIIHHWPAAPWMPTRASAKRMRCQCGFNTMNTRMRCSFRNTRLRPRKTNASAKRSKRCQSGYREDAKGGAAKSVRDRFTAPLRSGRIKSHRRTSHVSYVSHVSLTLRRHTMPGGFLTLGR